MEPSHISGSCGQIVHPGGVIFTQPQIRPVVSTGSTTAAPELVEGARGTGGRYGRTPQVLPRKRER